MRTGKKALAYLALTALVAGWSEVASFAFIRLYLARRALVYDPTPLLESFDPGKYQRYLAARHPLLGWPWSRWYGGVRRGMRMDASGARYSPAFPRPGNACVPLYGDSFTWGSDVYDAQAWGNALATRLNCRVANYGYPGFGTDQALLRFLHNDADEAPVVILSHFSGDIIRNVNRWIAFLKRPPNQHFWSRFKPRFVLDDSGKLQLVPLPTLDADELVAAIREPTEHIRDDYLIQELFATQVRGGFPFTLSLYRAYRRYFRVHPVSAESLRNIYTGNWLERFYDPDHPSGAHEVTRAILVEFGARAIEAGRIPLVFFIPHRLEIAHYRETGLWLTEPLMSAVSRIGARVVNVGELLVRHFGAEGICRAFSEPECEGHFNEAGYEVLAEIAHREIRGSPASL